MVKINYLWDRPIPVLDLHPFYNIDIQFPVWFKGISGKKGEKKNCPIFFYNCADKGIAGLQGALLGSDMSSTVTHRRLQPAEGGLCDAPEALVIRRDNLQRTSYLHHISEVQEGKRCEK